VGVFIVAAYLLFALVWLRTWRGWSAMLVGLPLIGLCLGLALAAKWVGLYAMGGIVLLILLRSALGRVLALLGMIMLTGFLGWLAVSSPSSSTTGPTGLLVVAVLAALAVAVGLRMAGAGRQLVLAGAIFAALSAGVLLLMPGNAIFLVIMLGLTIVLATSMVLRPVRLSLEEARFAIAAPAVLGIVGLLATIIGGPRLPEDSPISSTTGLAVSLGLIVVSVFVYVGLAMAGARGIGPRARQRTIAVP